MILFNIIAFGLLFRIIGGGIIQLPRWIPVCAVFALTGWQLLQIMQQLVATWFIFIVVRLLATRPLLDTTHGDTKAILRSFYRNMPIVIALPFVSWWYAIFLLQGVLYYVIGRIRARYPVFNSIAVSEIVSGAVFGGLI